MPSPPRSVEPAEFSDTLLSSHARRQLGEVNWDATSLGPPSGWPQSLRTTLEIMFSARYPMCAAWGSDLTFFYNDAYTPILGQRHPAMGKPIAEVWPDVWNDIVPLIRQAMSGEATWSEDAHLVMTRNGYEEDTWWTFSYSPLRDDDGRIAGFLDICTDSTAKILNERSRLAERERLEQSEVRFRALVNATSDVVFRMSRDWQEIRQLDGRGILTDVDAPATRWIESYVAEEDRAYVIETTAKAVAAKTVCELENRVIRADGSIGWMVSRAIPIFDTDGEIVEWFGMAADVTEDRRKSDHLRLVINELNHRVRNNLAMVQSIAMQTFRKAEDTEQAATRFTERLVALARANDLLTGERWAGVDLRGVLREAVIPHCEDLDCLTLEGPDIDVSAKSALAFTLAAHELATNATKYGAWSVLDGKVAISWNVRATPAGRFLHIEWTESDGPPVTPPTRRGFGSRLIERGLAAELDGKVVMDFQPTGFICRIEARLKAPDEA